jgi:hypothetical protein
MGESRKRREGWVNAKRRRDIARRLRAVADVMNNYAVPAAIKAAYAKDVAGIEERIIWEVALLGIPMKYRKRATTIRGESVTVLINELLAKQIDESKGKGIDYMVRRAYIKPEDFDLEAREIREAIRAGSPSEEAK